MDFVQLRDRVRLALWSDRRLVERNYRTAFGTDPDLVDPKRWTEIMAWKKLFDRNPLYTRCADKLAVREFVASRLGEDALIPLLASGETWDEIDFDSLEEPFIIKTSHGNGGNRVVRDWSQVDEKKVKRSFARRLKRNHYLRHREWEYKGIKPNLVVERLLLDENGEIPADYKFHCFNYGDEIEVIVLVVTGRHGDTRSAHFDESWNYLEYECVIPPPEEPPEQPDFMPELIAAAKSLAADFAYVRVDLYWANDQVYFGELTFTPDAGMRPISPDEWDFILGEKLRKTGILEKAGTSS